MCVENGVMVFENLAEVVKNSGENIK